MNCSSMKEHDSVLRIVWPPGRLPKAHRGDLGADNAHNRYHSFVGMNDHTNPGRARKHERGVAAPPTPAWTGRPPWEIEGRWSSRNLHVRNMT